MRAYVSRLLVVFIVSALVAGTVWVAWPAYPEAAPPLRRAPTPTYVFNDNTTLIVLFRFGAWVRVAYNNSQAVPPIMVYVYSRSGVPVELRDNYNHSAVATWGLALNASSVKVGKYYELWVKYKGKTYHFRFKPVKALKEEKKKGKEITLSLQEFRSWLDREAQYATALALLAFGLAVVLKRKLLLLSTFNAVNIGVVLFGGIAIYLLASKTGHSGYLAAPFALSYLATYKVLPVGRRVILVRIVPSMKRFITETAVLYRTAEGKLAYAKQSLGEAVKRWLSKHILVKDMETGKTGEISEDKLWTWEEVDTMSKYDAILVLDAELTKERVIEREGGELYE